MNYLLSSGPYDIYPDSNDGWSSSRYLFQSPASLTPPPPSTLRHPYQRQRHGEYKFDPVTEYVLKHGRKNGQLAMAWDFYAKYTLPK